MELDAEKRSRNSGGHGPLLGRIQRPPNATGDGHRRFGQLRARSSPLRPRRRPIIIHRAGNTVHHATRHRPSHHHQSRHPY